MPLIFVLFLGFSARNTTHRTKDNKKGTQPPSIIGRFFQCRFPEGGLVLRASGIYGNRDVGSVTVPLGAWMRPMEMVSRRGRLEGSVLF